MSRLKNWCGCNPQGRNGENMDELFKKLYDYIEPFEADWKKHIEPASNELIDELIEVTKVGGYAKRIPASYLKYLELMGEYDSGLISKLRIGGEPVKVSKLIGALKRYGYKEDLEKKRFPFAVDPVIKRIMFFDLTKENSEEVWYKGGSKIIRLSESFDKLMFQRVFDTIIHYKYSIYSIIIEERFDMAAEEQNIEKDELYKKVIQRIESHGIKETWFSEQNYYRGEGDGIAIGIEYYGGISCKIVSETEEKILFLREELSNVCNGQKFIDRGVSWWVP